MNQGKEPEEIVATRERVRKLQNEKKNQQKGIPNSFCKPNPSF